MAIKETERSEVESTYKWNLEEMFENNSKWEEVYQRLDNSYKDFSKFKGNILKNAEILYDSLEEYNNICMNLEDLIVYARMRSDEDTGNTYYQTLKGKIDNLSTRVSEEFSFYFPELLSGDYNLVQNYIKGYEKLKKYSWLLEDIFRGKAYILSEKEEKIISSLSNVLQASSRTAGLLRDSDLVFDSIVDEDGNEVKLTNSNFSVYIESANREVRKSAFYSMYKGYANIKNTLASTLSAEIEGTIAISKMRGYQSPLLYALFDDNINPKIYENLINSVTNNITILHEYYKMKKEKLNIKDFHVYDTYLPLKKEFTKKYSFEEGKDLVINALSILGEDYTKVLKSAFIDKWIDIYPNKGKRSGAYSSGTYQSYPYILLNYTEKLDDVSTLAHELGHSMHSYYSNKNNLYHNAGYSIFVAEVASTVNELLLYNYMLKNSIDKEEKQIILNELMEMFRGTIYRQTMFAEFELDIYNKAANEEVLTNEMLSNIYYKLCKKYYGDSVNVDEEIKYEWARIPHFYYFFYVYKYATGLSAAVKIVENILTYGEKYIEKYLNFLKSGGSDYPTELLKIADIDISNPNVVDSALKTFEKYIKEYDKI